VSEIIIHTTALVLTEIKNTKKISKDITVVVNQALLQAQ